MRGIVLADTGPLYAARDPNDHQHERSQRELRSLRSQNLKFVVPYPALLEGYALVMRKLGIREAHGFLYEVVNGSFLVNPTPEDYRKASLRLLRYEDQNITLVDAVITETADRLGAPAWTFDHHFDVMGAAVWR